MTISSVSSFTSTVTSLGPGAVSPANNDASPQNQGRDSATGKAQNLNDYNRELQRVDLELQQLYKSSAAAQSFRPKGSTSGLVDESA